MTKAVIDADFIAYACACAGETRSVKVTHKSSGKSLEIDTRTAWYGDWRKKEGGKLAEINQEKGTNYSWDDFIYEDIQRPEPISHVLHSTKLMLNGVVEKAGCSDHIGFVGRGEVFRHKLSTILEYKGNRKELLTPIHLAEVKDYMVRQLGCEWVENIEVDDRVIIEAYGKPNHVVIAVDKDAAAQPVRVFNPNYPELGIVNCNCLGQLEINAKGEVKGYGRKWLYQQWLSSDLSDNYAANSASDKRWGAKSAYKALVDTKTDKEAIQSVVDSYKLLYPEPKEVIGWRSDTILVDHMYMLQENFDMCRMLRSMDELENRLMVKDIFDKLGVEY